MSIYGNEYNNINEETIPEIDINLIIEMSQLSPAEYTYVTSIDEAFGDSLKIGFIEKIKKNLTNIKELKNQWKKVADKFVNHKWIYRYITPSQKEMLTKYYNMLTDEETSYQDYKKGYALICKFMGIDKKSTIIENLTFEMSKEDKEQEVCALKYSKGLAKVHIPEDVQLIHISPVDNIKELNPSFRSKVKGKYMYPTKRCFFTVLKKIKLTQSGLEGQKTYKYTPKQSYKDAYIDPTYSSFRQGSIYIETESPIPVERI